MKNSTRLWEYFGQKDPYYGVLSADEYRTDNLNETARDRFLASGEQTISELMRIMGCHLQFVPHGRALDFGCGVGRVLMPLCRRFEHVTGVDISSAMLAETRRNCERSGLHNIELLPADNDLIGNSEEFDFIHSCHVLQHNEPAKGLGIIASLARSLKHGGGGALHFPIKREISRRRALLNLARDRFTLVNGAFNVLERRRFLEPFIPFHVYPLNEVLGVLSANHTTTAITRIATIGSITDCYVLFRKE